MNRSWLMASIASRSAAIRARCSGDMIASGGIAARLVAAIAPSDARSWARWSSADIFEVVEPVAHGVEETSVTAPGAGGVEAFKMSLSISSSSRQEPRGFRLAAVTAVAVSPRASAEEFAALAAERLPIRFKPFGDVIVDLMVSPSRTGAPAALPRRFNGEFLYKSAPGALEVIRADRGEVAGQTTGPVIPRSARVGSHGHKLLSGGEDFHQAAVHPKRALLEISR